MNTETAHCLELEGEAVRRAPFDLLQYPFNHIAACAQQSLEAELMTWPKPGLVSYVDNGSHSDMDADTFKRSAQALAPFFAALAQAGFAAAGMATLRSIGIHAERAMLAATHGVNTHRGAIFALGLLSAAAGFRLACPAASTRPLGEIVRAQWGRDILIGPQAVDSHGAVVARRYGAGGARNEAANGFPTVYDIGLPALRDAQKLTGGSDEAVRVQTCFALIAQIEDTNLLHRGGPDGLIFAQHASRGFLAAGGIAQADWQAQAAAIHTEFVARNLSPGGAADLLAVTLFVEALR